MSVKKTRPYVGRIKSIARIGRIKVINHDSKLKLRIKLSNKIIETIALLNKWL